MVWETGETLHEVTGLELVELYKETPQSLGCSSVLNRFLTDKLLEIGSQAGLIIEKQRVKNFLKAMKGTSTTPI